MTTVASTYLSLGEKVEEVSICCHSDTPVSFLVILIQIPGLCCTGKGAVEIAKLVKSLVDESNRSAGYS